MVPLAIAVMNAGHSAWIAFAGEVTARLDEQWQIDCPICAMNAADRGRVADPTVFEHRRIEVADQLW